MAPRRPAQIPVRGTLITGDARSCQRNRCQQLIAAGGDELFFGKGHQPPREAAIALVGAEPPPDEPFPPVTAPDRHGRRQDVRHLPLTTAVTGALDWPGTRHVGRRGRRWEEHGPTGGETRLLVTSLGADHGAADVLPLACGHWQIEHGLHHPRDVTLGEDASPLRTGAAPQGRAALRNALLTVRRARGATNLAAARRETAWQGTALAMLGITLP